MPRREWTGCVYKPADRPNLHLKVKVDGVWRKKPTPFLPGQEAEAEALLADVRSALLAREAAMGGDTSPVTVRAWSKRWLESRRDDTFDEIHLRLHILPVIGDRLIGTIEPRHILEMVEGWEGAPRTIRNRYSTAHAMFRDAAVRGLIKFSPCILTRPAHMPSIEDSDSEWRPSAVFTRKELEQLISPHAEIEEDSTVTYALLGLAALRHGELAALRWRHYDAEREPLGSLLIANSNQRRRTKKGRTRLMPVHPLLATILAEWRLHGWARLMGRAPSDEDLVLPLPATKRRKAEAMRTKAFTWKRLDRHLEEVFKIRHRRVHDLRRTFITLATAGGADDRVLSWGTHGRPGDIMGAYGEAPWRRLCGEVAKLEATRRVGRKVVPLRRRAREDR